MQESDIVLLIESDPWMMSVIQAAGQLGLPDWMIGAGFVRNKVWDHLHGVQRPIVDTADIDLIYFDPTDVREETEKAYDACLRAKMNVPWATKNQARMHIVHNAEPYASTFDALSRWVETATAIAVTLDCNRVKLIAPYGVSDLVNLIVRPTPFFKDRLQTFHDRVTAKQWLVKWPKLSVVI